jgi:phage shock protein PspC (stress-responsive transcriptional regulator)
MRERLYRSRSDRMLFGVAGGMADWLDLDPSIVRLVWALLILAGGIGLVLYVVAAIVIPEEPVGYAAPAAATDQPGTDPPGTDPTRREARAARRARRGSGSRDGSVIVGLLLVLAGAWFLLDRFVRIDSSIVIPAVLIVVGIVFVLGAVRSARGPNGS